MKYFLRFGMILALAVIVGCGYVAARIVFAPAEDLVMPNLVDVPATDAVESLQRLGLLAKLDSVESTKPEGVIVSQIPRAEDRVASGKVVLLKVSKGTQALPVPDVRGLPFAEAVGKLDSAGFKVNTVLRVTDTLKTPGTVIAQNPAAPAMAAASRRVDLLVCEGAAGQSGLIEVPDVKGRTLEVARKILDSSALSVDRVLQVPSGSVPEGVIVNTRPRAGAKVASGSRVTLSVAVTPEASASTAASEQSAPGTASTTKASVPQTPSTPAVLPSAPSAPRAPLAPATQPSIPQTPSASTPAVSPPQTPATQTPAASEPSQPQKIAKVRYQVPPLARPLSLKITMRDKNGMRVLREVQATGGEYIAFDAPYVDEARVTVHLGGEFVWEDRFQ